MVRITVPDQQAEVLRKGDEAVLLVDEQGKVIGRFLPAFSAEEILEARRRAATESGGRTTAEVLERLARSENK
jgi:hypothetical protein